MFSKALFMAAKTWKQLNCPSRDDWIKKMLHLCTMEYYKTVPFVRYKTGSNKTNKQGKQTNTPSQTQTKVWCLPEGRGCGDSKG